MIPPVSVILFISFLFSTTNSTVLLSNLLDTGNTYGYGALDNAVSPYAEVFRRRCPLCDSSVYSYCSDKLFHDSCCCNFSTAYEPLPYQCKFADCSFLHANSCQEHKLITACCCTTAK